MAGMLYKTHRAEAQALSPAPRPLPAVAVGVILLAEGYATLAAAAALAAFLLSDAGSLLAFGVVRAGHLLHTPFQDRDATRNGDRCR